MMMIIVMRTMMVMRMMVMRTMIVRRMVTMIAMMDGDDDDTNGG